MKNESWIKSSIILGLLGITSLLVLQSTPKICIESDSLRQLTLNVEGSNIETPRCSSGHFVFANEQTANQAKLINQWAHQLSKIGLSNLDVQIKANGIEAQDLDNILNTIVSDGLKNKFASAAKLPLPERLAVEDFLKHTLFGKEIPEARVVSVEADPVHHAISEKTHHQVKNEISYMSRRGFVAKYLEVKYERLSFFRRFDFQKRLLERIDQGKLERPHQISYASSAEFIRDLESIFVAINPEFQKETFRDLLTEINQVFKPQSMVVLLSPAKAAETELNLANPKFSRTFDSVLVSGTLVSKNFDGQLELSDLIQPKAKEIMVVIDETTRLSELKRFSGMISRVTLVKKTGSFLRSIELSDKNPSTKVKVHIPSLILAEKFGFDLNNRILAAAFEPEKLQLDPLLTKLIGKNGAIPLFESSVASAL